MEPVVASNRLHHPDFDLAGLASNLDRTKQQMIFGAATGDFLPEQSYNVSLYGDFNILVMTRLGVILMAKIDQMAKVGEDDDEKRGIMVGGKDFAISSMDPTTRIIDKEVTAILANAHVATTEPMANEANTPINRRN